MTDTLLEMQRDRWERAHPELICPICGNSKDEDDPHCYAEACKAEWHAANKCDDCEQIHDGIDCPVPA